MSNTNRTVFYIGVTSDIVGRVREHKQGVASSFTTRYNCTELVYVEKFSAFITSIQREKQLKHRRRNWKLNLIRKANPTLDELDPFDYK